MEHRDDLPFWSQFLDGVEPLLTWQNESRMDDCALKVEVMHLLFDRLHSIEVQNEATK